MTIPACPECERIDQRSEVYDLGSSTTLLGGSFAFRGEDGKQHFHDPNTIRTEYRCSKGHIFGAVGKHPCPAGCDF